MAAADVLRVGRPEIPPEFVEKTVNGGKRGGGIGLSGAFHG